jgi:RHH-type proline utilization regulon transcriptional repressor/proline dehydrogenase/delta 1-pyrroline-5-carboxylate dehydrogenase
VASTDTGLLVQLGAILASGNQGVAVADAAVLRALEGVPAVIAARIATAASLDAAGPINAVLFEGDAAGLRSLAVALAEREGPILPLLAATPEAMLTADGYDPNRLLVECSISTNTAAAGGNASLMTIG